MCEYGSLVFFFPPFFQWLYGFCYALDRRVLTAYHYYVTFTLYAIASQYPKTNCLLAFMFDIRRAIIPCLSMAYALLALSEPLA